MTSQTETSDPAVEEALASASTGDAELIEQMVQMAAEPGEGAGTVVHTPTADNPYPQVISSVESAGYVMIYDTETGEPSKCNGNMLLANLRKTRADGTRVFTTKKPAFDPFRGSLKCWLHAEHEDRIKFGDFGFAECRKSNLRSPYEVERHMQRRHQTEYAIIQRQKDEEYRTRFDADSQEDRLLRRELLNRLATQAEGGA